MNDKQINELLRLTKENNEMLGKIMAYIEKITDDDYLASIYSKNLSIML